VTDEVKAYCMKCKAERTMSNVTVVTMKNGRPAANGTCPVCGTKMFKFLPKAYTAQAESANTEPAPAVENTNAEPAAPTDG
jgi:predicted  nucleic acid-binding Zn-ribbon protein